MKMFPPTGFDFDWYIGQIQTELKVTKQTKVVSLGSCFAREIRNFLLASGYNYLTGETEKDCYVDLFPGDNGMHKSDHGSIAWERVYHVHTFYQIIRYSFGKEYDRIHPFIHKGKTYYTDLLRTRMVYPDMQTAETDIADHIQHSKRTLLDADLLIFTLGLTEVNRFNGIVLGSLPKGVKIDKQFEATNYGENLALLNKTVDVLQEQNPKLQILFTVSPVHLLATSRDIDCVVASCASKSILRAVADTITKREGVHYFPSYEIANIVFPLLGKQSYPDNHHVSREVVQHIMKAFEQKCLI